VSGRQKVVLYNPRAVFWTMPLGPLAVGSHLPKNRYEVVIVDGRLEADPVDAVLSRLDGAACLGVSVLTGAPIRDALEVSRAAKARIPALPVVWGGWHPSLFPTECLDEASVDVTVAGQGEETFLELLGRLEGGDGPAGCAGTAYRGAGGQALRNPPRAFAEVGTFSPLDFDLLPVERYFTLKGKRQLDYIASQGCRFRCAFCADPYVFGRQWSGLSPERMGEELERLWKRWRFTDVNFQDETFFTRLDRVAEVAEQFLRRGLPFSWAGTMRADQGERLTEEVMATARRSGLRRVMIGVESGSQETLDRIRKDIRLEQVFHVAEKCLRHGVAVIFPFIVCFPDESDASILASLEMARALRAMSRTFQTPLFYFKPYPGIPLTEEAVRKGYRPPRTLEEWSRFDIYDADSPWVTPARERWIERYKYYLERAYTAGTPWNAPLRRLARWRVEHSVLSLPVEKAIGERLFPAPVLS
jgi:anaerobic magnesium-protoporphyrin IX monomethyl ester cyclase